MSHSAAAQATACPWLPEECVTILLGVSPLSTKLRIALRAPAPLPSEETLNTANGLTSGFEGASLLKVLTFEEELFTSREIEGVAGEDLGLVDLRGYSAGRLLYIS